MAQYKRLLLRAICKFAALPFLWIVFSKFVVPPVIESAYRGTSLPFLNEIISGQAVNSLEHYLAVWQMMSGRVLEMLVVLGLIPLPLLLTWPEVQECLEGRWRNSVRLRPASVNTVLALLGFALFPYLYFLDPVGYIYLTHEEHLIEYGSFVSWAMAFCFWTWMLLSDRGNWKPGFVLLALGASFVAMEEISWGQRIVGFGSPGVFAEYNLQGETNVHNLIPIRRPLYVAAGIATFLWSILLPLLNRRCARLRDFCNKLGIPVVPTHLWPFFVLAISYLVVYVPLESEGKAEMAELFLGIAIAALSLDLVLTIRGGGRVHAGMSTVATVGMIATVGALALLLVQFHDLQEGLRWRLNYFATTAYPNAGMYQQAELVFDYINKHPQFLTSETHFRQSLLLAEMGNNRQAEEMLKLALAEQKALMKPDGLSPYRVAGQVLLLLGRKQEAEAAFVQAIRTDLARLERVRDAGDEVLVRWSLAKTLLASGSSEAAWQQAMMARGLARDRSTQFQIEEWIRKDLNEAFAKPGGSPD